MNWTEPGFAHQRRLGLEAASFNDLLAALTELRWYVRRAATASTMRSFTLL